LTVGGWRAFAAVNVALAVAIGAFGAHGLRGRVPEAAIETLRTGQAYHLTMSVALLACAHFVGAWRSVLAAGILVFAGSLYALALSGVRVWGAVTPVGGALMIAAWLWLAVGQAKHKSGETG
jgi:uncharacterized membrane protein YgdD (TMEM256/DUF423 family)